ncbi:hypothetical protein [Flavobacterium praedii]|uniref:hypothetical protein n=1 Tax=Flavobacterium praedii TaxID=3002900 RepID=UPI002481F959|nr:hypothetical protein [Flavobacterium praedii]
MKRTEVDTKLKIAKLIKIETLTRNILRQINITNEIANVMLTFNIVINGAIPISPPE